jgi:MFS transporter, MHS family, proline/betaine transporter
LHAQDVISQVFFPPEDAAEEAGNANLLKSFVIFGSAFLMRPFGGLMIGYIGDKHGRKAALTQSLFMMALSTTLMGCLPTYQQVGVFSTILLCLCRLIQGISVGGQLPASLVYTVEKRPKQHWGYYGSLPMVAANVGTLLGNLCGALMRQVLTEEQLLSWGGGCHSFRASSLPLWLATCGGRVTMCIPIGECTIGKIPKSPIQSAWQSEKEIDWRC